MFFSAVGHRLILSLSFPHVRDDLFRVELDNVVGEEMFYSKVRFYPSNTHPHNLCAEKKRPSLLNFTRVLLCYRRGRGNPTKMTSESVE